MGRECSTTSRWRRRRRRTRLLEEERVSDAVDDGRAPQEIVRGLQRTRSMKGTKKKNSLEIFFYTGNRCTAQMREKRRRKSEWRPTTGEAGCMSRVFLFVFVNYEFFFFLYFVFRDERRAIAKRQAKERVGPA